MQIFTTYDEACGFLFNQLAQYKKYGTGAINKGLENIRALCAALGNPHEKLTCIHVAGTNGKGSVSHTLHNILTEAGYKVGLYTSPHVRDFSERIRINGRLITPHEVVAFMNKAQPLALRHTPSFFELTVAMAFDHFHQHQVDIAVIETGLGGRWDSTNIITPILSVITHINYDHQALLGHDLLEIAHEKAGIIKEGVPVVVGEKTPLVRVFLVQTAAERSASCYVTGDLSVRTISQGLLEHRVALYAGSGQEVEVDLSIAASYYADNLPIVLSSVKALQLGGLEVKRSHVASGIAMTGAKTGCIGRWQCIGKSPLVVCDAAHNTHGLRAAFAFLARHNEAKVWVIMGFSQEKDLDELFGVLPTFPTYCFVEASMARACPLDKLAAHATARGLRYACYAGVSVALAAVRAEANASDMVLICGSIYVLGELTELADAT